MLLILRAHTRRRAFAFIVATLTLVVMWIATVADASAAPRVTMRVRAGPIPAWRPSGNIAGTAAELRVEFSVVGTEYAGGPAPITGIDLWLPLGIKLRYRELPGCPESGVTAVPPACPRGSHLGLPGTMEGLVSSGGSRATRTTELAPFVGLRGSVLFLASLHVGEGPADLRSERHRITAREGHGDLSSALPEAPVRGSCRRRERCQRRVMPASEAPFTGPQLCAAPRG